jgi:ribosomal subunit interface protein
MNIETRSSNVSLSEALHEHILRKLERVLRHFATRIDGVVVRLTDINGPRGGTDKRCRILVRRTGQSSLLVEAVSESPYDAVSHAVARLDERFDRSVTRGRVARQSLRRSVRRRAPSPVSPGSRALEQGR